jgi:hypothetical protein
MSETQRKWQDEEQNRVSKSFQFFTNIIKIIISKTTRLADHVTRSGTVENAEEAG